MSLETKIRHQFSEELNSSLNSEVLISHNEYFDAEEFYKKLNSSNLKITEIANPDVFFRIEHDSLNWLAWVDCDFFLKLLPAFMLVSLTKNRVDAENLRGFLLGYLSPSKFSSDYQLTVVNHVYQTLSAEKVEVVEEFIKFCET
jgi:hypothetical protein